MSLVGGLGGLIGLGIAATAAYTLIKVTGNQLNQVNHCKVCGHSNANRQSVVTHIKRSHPQELRAAHINMRQQRPRSTSWVY